MCVFNFGLSLEKDGIMLCAREDLKYEEIRNWGVCEFAWFVNLENSRRLAKCFCVM